MAELKSLQDFYNPTLAMSALNYQVNQQHLALQQQQLAQQGQNQEIDNLRQAAALAIKENPMAAPSAYNAWAERVGMAPITDPAAFIANPKPFYEQLRYQPGTPEHEQASQSILGMGETQRARSKDEFERQMLLEGNTKLSVASGGPSDPASGFALSQSKPGQEEAYKRIFDPAKQAKVVMNQDYMNQRAGIHAELDPLLSVHMQATDALSNLEPIAAQLPPLLAQREKDIATLGRNKAMGKYNETLKSSPEVAEYIERAKASLPQIEQQIQEIQAMRSESLLKAQKIAAGVRPATETDNIHALAGQANAQALHLQYLKAQKALAKDPTNPANIEAVKQIAQAMNARIEHLHTTKTSLDVSRDAQQEAARKNRYQEDLEARTSKGGSLLLEAVGRGEKMDVAAARIATQLGVSPTDIKKALANPDKPLVSITQGQEKAEASVVGTEFGKQYTTLQNAAVSASDKLSKLDRMEQLLQGVSTGKLTPAITQVQAIGEALGIQVDKTLPAKQALESLTNEIALGLRNPSGGAGMPGALSDKDREFLLAMPAGLGKTPEGNRLIIETSRALEQRSQHVAKMARAYRKKNGQFDEGFLEELQTYSEKHPLFSGKDKAAIPQASDYDSLPSGSVYQAPDGTMRRKK